MIQIIAPEPKLLVRIHADGDTIVAVDLLPHDSFALEEPDRFPQILPWLEKYSRRERAPLPDSVPVPQQTAFSGKILERLAEVPFGQSLSYGELAAAAGHEGAARATGSACGGNPFPLFIPCHRVLSANGGLGGFRLGPTIKRLLLDFEGIVYH